MNVDSFFSNELGETPNDILRNLNNKKKSGPLYYNLYSRHVNNYEFMLILLKHKKNRIRIYVVFRPL